MVQEASLAVIPANLTDRAAICDMQLAATMTTAQETRQKRLAAADRAARHETFAVGVVGDQALIPLELGPREIAFVVVQEQDVPIRPLTPEPTHDPLAAGLDRHAAAGSAESIGASIDRIAQNMVDRVVDRQPPGDATAFFRRITNHRSAVRAFFLSITALAFALLLAIYSGTAAELGHLALAIASALGALLVAAWVAVTLVPILAKRTPLRWIGYKMEYRVTREGWIYILGIFLVAVAALNTGNNLLFLILASLIAIILMSGVLSSITLSGVEMRLQLPEHIFAGQPVRSLVEVQNEKLTLPSFSLRVEAVRGKHAANAAMLETPVYFPYIPKHDSVQQHVPMTFPRRGIYSQEAFRIVTRFPFGFLQKARRVDLKSEALVYPSVEPTRNFFEVLPGMQGALESLAKGRGQDLYAFAITNRGTVLATCTGKLPRDSVL